MSTKILFEEQIREFLLAQIEEIENEQNQLQEFQTTQVNLLNVVEKTLQLGQKAGIVQGKLEMLKKIEQFLSSN